MSSVWKHPKSQYWVACYTGPDGRQMKRSTRIVATQKSRRQAEKIAEAYEEAARRKNTSAQVRRVFADIHEQIVGTPLTETTVRSYVTKWLAAKKNETKETTLSFYRATTDRFLEWLEDRADVAIDEIGTDEIRKYVATRRGQVSAVTANHELKSLRTMFRAAKADGELIENPADDISAAKERRQQSRRPFTKEEIQKLLVSADSEWRSMIVCALYTGQRLGDIAALTWDAFDLKKGEYRLVTMKTGKALHLPIPPPLLKHLKSLPKGEQAAPLHERAFKSLKAKGRTGELSRQFGDLLANAGLRAKTPHRKAEGGKGRDGAHTRQPLSFHSFRNTATTWLHEANVPLAVVQAMIGHDSTAVHAIYVNVGKEALIKAANAFPKLK